jgi:hypothetical protein
MSQMKRVSFTVPPQLVDDLGYLSERLGVTRSAIISDLMLDPLHDLRGLVEMIPAKATPEDVKRMRGASVDLVTERLASLRKLDNDLLS